MYFQRVGTRIIRSVSRKHDTEKVRYEVGNPNPNPPESQTVSQEISSHGTVRCIRTLQTGPHEEEIARV